MEPEAGGIDLRVGLDTTLPSFLPTGSATAVFCCGTCFHRRQRVERLEIAVDGVRHKVAAARMPRPDLFADLHPALDRDRGSVGGDPASPEDPEIRCYRSGFWATIPIDGRSRAGDIALRLEAELADGSTASAPLGAIPLTEPNTPPSYEQLGVGRPGDGVIAICMATFDPEPELFRVQVDSLRAQTDARWICLISDDCSRPDRFEVIERIVGTDPRFVISRSERHLGFYRNFESALMMVPREVEFVALCDQDDRWYPDKLAILRAAIGDAQLAYSDQRLVDADGRVLRETLWDRRRNNHTNFTSLLIANTIVGAASLFRRRVIELALPFPQGPGWEFHDHWLALVAMATGSLTYVDRPLYDYVQHAGAILGQVAVENRTAERRDSVERLRAWVRRRRAFFGRWRAAYFSAYLQLELQARVLLIRCGGELTGTKRRALRRLIAAGRSPFGVLWLALRFLRPLLGRNETLGTEMLLVRGILWRRLISLRVGRREQPEGATYTAGPPAFEPDSFGPARIRRWLASHREQG